MATNVNSSLARLTSLSQVLSNASDQLSQNISEIESALNALNLGVWAWVKDDPLKVEEITLPASDGQTKTVHRLEELGYGKHKGKWAFLMASGDEETWQQDVSITFLCDAPLEMKMLAMERIPKLLELVAEGVQTITQEAAQKTAEAKEIAAGLRRS